jgi:hypothetical protein
LKNRDSGAFSTAVLSSVFALDGSEHVPKMIQYAYNSPNCDPGCAGFRHAARQLPPGYHFRRFPDFFNSPTVPYYLNTQRKISAFPTMGFWTISSLPGQELAGYDLDLTELDRV